MTETYAPVAALRLLVERGVRFVLIGGVAGNLHGSPIVTNDLDICYARDDENSERLAGVLRDLRASLRGATEGLPFALDARTLKAGGVFTFDTDVGPLDCLGTPSGVGGFAELERGAEDLDLVGITVRVCSLSDLIRMKRAAGRPKDLLAIETLGALQEEIDRAAIERRRKPT